MCEGQVTVSNILQCAGQKQKERAVTMFEIILSPLIQYDSGFIETGLQNVTLMEDTGWVIAPPSKSQIVVVYK